MPRRPRVRAKRGDGYRKVLPDGRIRVRHSWTTGGIRHQKAKTFDLAGDADWWLARAKRDGTPPEDMTVAEYLERWLRGKRRIRPSTATMYREHIDLHIAPLGGFDLTELRRHHVEEWVDELGRKPGAKGRPLSPSTVGKVLGTLRRALAAAVPESLPDNPAAKVEAPAVPKRLPRVVGTDEAARILQAVTGTWVEPIARFLFGSGLRIGEAVSIDQGDIDWAASRVAIRASKTELRWVTVGEDAIAGLRLALVQAPRRGDREPVFFSPRRRKGEHGQRDRLLPSSVTHALHGIAGLGSHTLRHAFATVALENNVPIEAIADQLGHKSTRMTRQYAHVTEDMRRASLATVHDAVARRREVSG